MGTHNELTLDELNQAAGGFVVQVQTGNIGIDISDKGSTITWPGKVDGVSGTWTWGSDGSIGWQRG